MNRLLVSALLILCITACSKVESRKDEDLITSLENEMKEMKKDKNFSVVNPEFTKKALSLREAYLKFAGAHPKSTQAPEYLYKAAMISHNEINEPQRAVELYDTLIAKYPDHNSAADALFMKAWITNNVLNKGQDAENFYRQFLEKYPDHKQAPGAEMELRLLHGDPVDAKPEESGNAKTHSH